MTAALVCLDPGPAATIQDEGRFGWRRFGLPPSGAMDASAMRLANRLVGNPAGTAVVELGLKGGRWRLEAESARIAVAGADCPLTIDDTPADAWRSHRLERGQTLAIGAARAGLWGYLAVAGGFALQPVLGSLSTHARAGIGGLEGRRLQAGDSLPLSCDRAAAGPERALPRPPSLVLRRPVRVVLGPQEGSFEAGGIRCFLEEAWQVGPAVDRMAYRLDGPAIAHADGFNIVSDGILRGSIQVPGNGRPIVMMADHQTTGGYPKIATVIAADRDRLAQQPPGTSIRFEAVDLGLADQARVRRLAEIAALENGLVEAGGKAQLDSERLLQLNLVDGVVDAAADI